MTTALSFAFLPAIFASEMPIRISQRNTGCTITNSYSE